MNLVNALISLCPGAQWTLSGDTYDGLDWLPNNTISKPSEEALKAEAARLEEIQKATEYQRLRAKEYPPVTDYLDGLVKGDQAQMDKYIADCQAVKNKYPKPDTE